MGDNQMSSIMHISTFTHSWRRSANLESFYFLPPVSALSASSAESENSGGGGAVAAAAERVGNH